MKTTHIIPALSLAALLMLPSCNKDDNGGPDPDSPTPASSFRVKMTDGPGQFSAMNLQVTKVEAYLQDSGQGQDRWINLNATSQTVSVIELTNGKEIILAQDDTPEKGRYSKLRLTFGNDNHLQLLGGSQNWLTLGFNSQSSHEVVIDIEDEQVDGSSSHEVLLDFNVALSVHQDGSSYWIDPVITEIQDASTGARGQIHGSLYSSVMFQSQDNHNYQTYTTADGQFLIRGMLDGTYNLVIEGQDLDDHQMGEMTIQNVIIVHGEIKNMGTINFD